MPTAHLIKMNLIKRVIEDIGLKQTWLAEKLSKSYAIFNAYLEIVNKLGLLFYMKFWAFSRLNLKNQ
jgi:hypothetical protein